MKNYRTLEKPRNRSGRYASKSGRWVALPLLTAIVLVGAYFWVSGNPTDPTKLWGIVPKIKAEELELLSPIPTSSPNTTPKPTATPTPTPIASKYLQGRLDPGTQDVWIGVYADKFATKKISSSKLRYQLHCLAHKENGHSANNKCGDNGNACGMYQFWAETWQRMRGQMLKKGLITEIGDRWNDQQAIETTAYAITHGMEKEWGPILRGGCL